MASPDSPDRDPMFETVLEHLQRSRGFDFTGYKRTSLTRRVQKRMEVVGIQAYGDYVDYLGIHPEEFGLLFNTVLINVTEFFRDGAAWDYLAREIVPKIVATPSRSIRVWCAGVASGEEAYTTAILFAEALGTERFLERVKIYATDVDEEALSQAHQASYAQASVAALPGDLRRRYFLETGDRYVFRPDLRRAVILGRHDLVQDAPISRLDLLVCRNTLMYLQAETQARILNGFHFALKEDGVLFLGKAEMLLSHANLFAPVDLRYRIYCKIPNSDLHHDRARRPASSAEWETTNAGCTWTGPYGGRRETIRMRDEKSKVTNRQHAGTNE